jgi:hypothetical protein
MCVEKSSKDCGHDESLHKKKTGEIKEALTP